MNNLNILELNSKILEDINLKGLSWNIHTVTTWYGNSTFFTYKIEEFTKLKIFRLHLSLNSSYFNIKIGDFNTLEEAKFYATNHYVDFIGKLL